MRTWPQQNTQLCPCVCRATWRSLAGMRNFAFSRLAAVAVASVIALSAVFSGVAVAQQRLAAPGQKPTIVLVHGAFADASSWSGVIRRLQMDGYPVLAPANPLRGLASDAAYLSAFLNTVTGPTILVGHSYGGAVISNAAAGHSNVTALVYVAAYIPDVGQTLGELSPASGGSQLVPPGVPGVTPTLLVRPCPPDSCAAGAEAYVDPAFFHQVFAADVPREQSDVIAVAQRPLSVSVFSEKSTAAAWKTIPSFALIANQDHAIGTANELAMAQHAGAQIVRVDGSHLVMVARPGEVVELIRSAANSSK